MAEPSDEPALTPDLVALIHGGVAAVVATRNELMEPAITRAWGTEVSVEQGIMNLCVVAPQGSPTRENLEQHLEIAVSFSPPTIATAFQIKGTVTEVSEPDAATLERAEQHLVAFTEEAIKVGASANQARRLFAPTEFLAVTASIEEVFDQTPGPGAGRQL